MLTADDLDIALAALVPHDPDYPDELSVLADAYEDVGDDERATMLRWRAVLALACTVTGGVRVGDPDSRWEASVSYATSTDPLIRIDYRESGLVGWSGAWYSAVSGWTDANDRRRDPPACADAVLAALRKHLAERTQP